MTTDGTVRLDDGVRALKERKRFIDDVWLIVCCAVLMATGVPWYLRLLDIDFAPIAWSLFAYGFFCVGSSIVADRFETRRSLLLVVGAVHLTGVIFLGWIWHLAGGVQNPMFVLIFVLPVVAGGLVLVSWHTYAMAALSIGTVVTVALIDAPELRWYVAQHGSWARKVMGMLPAASVTAAPPFPGLSMPPSYLLVQLLLFVVIMATVALITEAFSALLRRLYGRVESSTAALARAETLSSDVLQAAPTPSALVYADTFKIAYASTSFLHHMMTSADDLLTKSLFGVAEFTYPEVIESLITKGGGTVPLAAYRVGGELRVASVRVDPVSHGGRRYAYVSLQDVRDLQYLQMAMDAIDTALLVLSDGQVLYFNLAAKRVFADLEPGVDAATPLGRGSLPGGWWELRSRSRQERQVNFDGVLYAASCAAAAILGEPEPLTIVSLQPALSR